MSATKTRGERRRKETAADGVSVKILGCARERVFAAGYSAFKMDDLAAELGMSKKTLYVYFRGKDDLVRAVFEAFAAGLRSEAERLLAERGLGFAEKLRGFAQAAVGRLARVRPEILADLQRGAPRLHRHVQELRAKNLPYIFGRFIEEGQRAGAVREDVSPVFASEFYLHAMQGLMQPEVLQRLRTRPELAFEEGLRIFFGGLLTAAGKKEYEKLFPH